MLKLTAIIPTGNEEQNIDAAIESVKFADEILIVDSFSTDRTMERAKQHDVRIIQREYGNSASQKNWAIPQATHEWILLLDADERITPELAEEVQQILKEGPKHDGYWMYRDNYFLGHPIKHSWKGDKVIRLFHRDRCKYEEKHVHAEIITDGSVGWCKHRIIHNTYVSYDAFVKKLNRYAQWQAFDYAPRTGRITFWHLWVKPAFRFWKHYVAKGGFRDGIPGFIIASLQAYGVKARYYKIWLMRQEEKGANAKVDQLFKIRRD